MSPFLLLLSLFLLSVQSMPTTKTDMSTCFQKIEDMKNILQKIQLQQETSGNVTFGNLGVFHEMCTDYTNCLEAIEMPDFLKGIMSFATSFVRKSCDDLGFKVGPFSKCIEKTRFDIKILKNITGELNGKKCELTDNEYSELESMVRDKCDVDAWKDMIRNEKRVMAVLCE